MTSFAQVSSEATHAAIQSLTPTLARLHSPTQPTPASDRRIRPPSSAPILDYFEADRGHGSLQNKSISLLDLGCGHGLTSRDLAPKFTRVTAVDPSAGMVEQAEAITRDPKISIIKGSAEDLSFLLDSSVDLAIAGQAAHWFDYERAWSELARVLKQRGSLAFWGYKDNIINGHPQTNSIYRRFMYSKGDVQPDIEGLGRFWEDPGRSILRDSYQAIVLPEEDWEDVVRVAWDPDDSPTGGNREGPDWCNLDEETAQAGSFNNWKAEYPGRKSKAEGGDGDVIDALFEELIEAVPEWKAEGDRWREAEVECVWGTCLLMARRK